LFYQWQAMASGSGSWTDLSDNGTYAGSATAVLAVSGANYAMTGTQFQCVVGNASGAAVSAPVALKVNPVGVTTLAGWPGDAGSVDGVGRAALFVSPGGLSVDGQGNVYVADGGANTIRKVTPGGVVTTVAGSPGVSGTANGSAGTALFNGPAGVVADASGNLYVADNGNYVIREISASGVVSTFAGSGIRGTRDGTGTAAQFYDPQNLTMDAAGNLYIADGAGDTIRMITPAGVVATIAGTARQAGFENAAGTSARFNTPTGVAVDSAGNLYIADYGNNMVRKISPGPAYNVTTLAGAYNLQGSVDATGSSAEFYAPSGVTVDSAGNVYVADSGNDTIRMITPAGAVTTLAGSAGVAENTDGYASAARFNAPSDIGIDGAGNLYVADLANCTIRRIVQGALVPPLIQAQPQSQTISTGSGLTLSVTASGPGLTYQWYLNGAAIAGATAASYTNSNAGANAAGTYTVVVNNGVGAVTSSAATLGVQTNARLINESVLADIQGMLTVGFVIGGAGTSGSENLLIRATGPALTNFEVTGFMPDPTLTVIQQSGAVPVASNSGWGSNQAAVTAADTATGAFALTNPASLDSALVIPLPAIGGGYTVQVKGASGDSGNALTEVYDDSGSSYTVATPRLINISCIDQVPAGGMLTAGFVISGSTSFVIASNAGWGGNSQISSVAAAVGAFAWPTNPPGADSAVVLTLAPGTYTAEVSSVSGAGGNVLIEVYEVR
jgi:sugar lactone lactonase YvrE